jgi:(1->4)-alpha-D-glucan 1-alpha-D-glucosylmutase
MKAPNALRMLASYCGIADSYLDVWGNPHATSDETRHALLTAMHLPVQDADPALILRAFQQADWQRMLPPVQVVRSGESMRIELGIPARAAKLPWRWTLRYESGEVRSAEFIPAGLPKLGKRRLASADFSQPAKTAEVLRCALELPGIAVLGYHHFEIEMPGSDIRPGMTLIVAPPTCYQPAAIRGDGRVWGPTVQLYGLRSRRNWGIGDFTDLRNLVDITADAGGGIVGVNPLHALFPDNPTHASPYSPSSRSALNLLYIDVEALPEFRECTAAQALVAEPAFQARLRSLRAEAMVNYPAVAVAKREAFDLLYRHFREQHLANNSEHAQAFLRYRENAGALLERLARFEALQAHFRAADPKVWGWPAWPADYRDPDGPAIAEYARQHAETVNFHAWLQWAADTQLAAVGRQSWQRGLGIGLYADFAVGANPGGADVWSWQGVFAAGAYTGAPPEEINLNGQDWGLPPFVPHRLREVAYAPLIEALRENMRHAGALRIDHVMCLTRVFWVPAGKPAATGTYVSYPFEDLLGIVALESLHNQCLVIGEDLGTVPEGFRRRLASADFLSYHPFFFEHGADGGFSPPAEFPAQALVAVSTHDLPTLAGFWQGSDLDARTALQLFPTEQLRESLVVGRAQDRARLLMALEREKLLPEGAGIHPVAVPELTVPFILGVHAYLARTPARVLAVQPEDILGIVEQANLPGTLDEQHPNWRRRLTLDIEEWRTDERFLQFGEVLRRERGSAVMPHPVPAKVPRVATIPRATYRFQFNREFTFAQATALVPYLADLGISHCYASPYLKARPGSSHGYDIVDHAALNPEIGTPEDYERFVAALHAHRMGQILDIVPNHMGVMGADNAWWLDVLENGPAAAHGNFFDIDWEPLNPNLQGKVLLPLLGDQYGSVLNRGELRLDFDAGRGEFNLFYYQHRLPIDPATYPRIVGQRIERLTAALGQRGDGDERLSELQSLLTAFNHLPTRLEPDPALVTERQRDKEVYKRHLASLCTTCTDIARHVQDNLAVFNGRADDPTSFDLLHELILAQGYRLAYWRVASDEINYRRFFDINDLAALRMEDPAVFDTTHRFVLALVAQGKIDGLRIDHPDGLHDPGQYFRRLQEQAAGTALVPGDALPLYLVIEKILADHEQLPTDWLIHGATGYRFANLANALFVDPAATRRLTRIYDDFVGEEVHFEALVYRSKKLVMDNAMASELNVLANRLARLAAASRDTCDFTLNGLREALAEVVANFPVYRSYISAAGISPDDRRHIEWAVAVAKKHSPAAEVSIFDFILGVLTTDIAQNRGEAFRDAVTAFTMRFQQFSSPVTAKGVEDTAFYRYHRLVSLNDVGGDPRRCGVSVAAYHAATRTRAQRWMHNLLATSTHDSKRAEDVRTRIDVLSEMPAAWKLMLKRWRRINRARLREIDGQAAPSANDEYLLYQTLVGTWPASVPGDVDLEGYRRRIETYLVKAVREAKEHSSWVNVNTAYETALADFIAALLAPGEKNLFLADFVPTVRRITHHGYLNSLALTLLKLTSPGVPDIYQGCELWQFNLVDPDNRRPVDYGLRRQLLDELHGLDAASPEAWTEPLRAMLDDMSDGRVKLHLIHRALALREQFPALFSAGDYLPLTVTGERALHVCAYARQLGEQAIIAIVPRLTMKLLTAAGGRSELPHGEAVWRDTAIELPRTLGGRTWRNVLTREEHKANLALPLSTLIAVFPVALLVSA